MDALTNFMRFFVNIFDWVCCFVRPCRAVQEESDQLLSLFELLPREVRERIAPFTVESLKVVEVDALLSHFPNWSLSSGAVECTASLAKDVQSLLTLRAAHANPEAFDTAILLPVLARRGWTVDDLEAKIEKVVFCSSETMVCVDLYFKWNDF